MGRGGDEASPQTEDGPMSADSANHAIGYFWGEDAFEIERAVSAFAKLAGGAEGPLEIWRSPTEDETAGDAGDGGGATATKRRARLLDEAAMRLGTAPMFGGGTLVVIRQPGAIVREKAAEQRLIDLVGQVPPGNALAFSDITASGGKTPAGSGSIANAVKLERGLVREYPALTRERMESWIIDRGADLHVGFGPGAARLLAERVGAYVREADVDRRRQSALAHAELEKLALYRPDGVISREDVAELVTEAIPGSTWAFLDATAIRRGSEASRLGALLMDSGTPMPVLIGQLHRRLRELISVREHLDSGSRPGDLVRIMKLQPFRAQKLAEQAQVWQMGGLESALEGLVDLDLQSKGITRDGSTVQMSEARDALGLQVWIAEHAARR
jgi:DNA polymerase III delta subunit